MNVFDLSFLCLLDNNQYPKIGQFKFVKGRVVICYPLYQSEEIARRRRTWLKSCVQRHLHQRKGFPFTSRPTLGSNTHVRSATSHSLRMVLWRGTPSFTVGRNRTSAHSATFHATTLPPSENTWRNTPGKNSTIAIIVNIKQQVQATWRSISRSTQEKNCINAINVNTKQQYQETCKGTRRLTLVKSHRDVQCASIHAFKLANWNTI